MSWYLVLFSCLDFFMVNSEASLRESRYAEMDAFAKGDMLLHINFEGRLSWEWIERVSFTLFLRFLEFDVTMFNLSALNSFIFWKKSTLFDGTIDPSWVASPDFLSFFKCREGNKKHLLYLLGVGFTSISLKIFASLFILTISSPNPSLHLDYRLPCLRWLMDLACSSFLSFFMILSFSSCLKLTICLRFSYG